MCEPHKTQIKPHPVFKSIIRSLYETHFPPIVLFLGHYPLPQAPELVFQFAFLVAFDAFLPDGFVEVHLSELKGE